MSINRTELVAQMAERSGLTKAQADSALGAFQSVIIDALSQGESVSDFLAADEPFDADAKAAREYHFVALQQLALRHLIG